MRLALAAVMLTAVVIGGQSLTENASAASTWGPPTDSALITNGDFETGDLVGFIAEGINDGFAAVVEEGRCFSYYDTSGIKFSGQFAAVVRASNSAPVDSIGILTSASFAAGDSVSFEALSESVIGIVDPVDLEVRILTGEDVVLTSQKVTANLIYMSRPCGSDPQDAAFSQHAIDTSAFLGQSIKIQFRQHTNYALNGYFTLLDDIKKSVVDGCAATAETSLTACGFEVPILGDGNFSYATPGSAWSFNNSAGITSNNSGFTGTQPAPQGQQVAFLQGGGSRIEQVINGFASDRRYTLTFSAAQRDDNAQDFVLLWDGALLGVFRPTNSSYAEFSVSLATTVGPHALQFIGLDTVGGDHTAFIDNIRLVSSPLETGAPSQSKQTIFAAYCPQLRPDIFSVSAVFFASDAAPSPGTTSAFHVVGTTQVIIVYTAGTDRIAMERGFYCNFVPYQAGPLPPAPFDRLFSAWAFVVPERR